MNPVKQEPLSWSHLEEEMGPERLSDLPEITLQEEGGKRATIHCFCKFLRFNVKDSETMLLIPTQR